MEANLKYQFKRQSKNHFDWLINFVKSERYYEIEATLVNTKNTMYID